MANEANIHESADRYVCGVQATQPDQAALKYFFAFCYSLQQHAGLSLSTSAFMMLVSNYQSLGLLLDNNITEKTQAAPKDLIVDMLQYTRVVPYILHSRSVTLYIFAGIVAFLLILWIIYNGFNALLYRSRKHLLAISEIAYAVYWILLVPMMEFLLSVWRCDSRRHIVLTNVDCFGTGHVLMCIFYSLGLLLWLGVVIILTLACTKTNGLTHDPFARYPWAHELVYTIIRTYMCVHVHLISPSNSWLLLTTLMLYSLYLGSLYLDDHTYYSHLLSALFKAWVFVCAATVVCVIVFAIMESVDVSIRRKSVLLTPLHAVLYFTAFRLNDRQRRRLITTKTFTLPQTLDLYLMQSYKSYIISDWPQLLPQACFSDTLHLHQPQCAEACCPIVEEREQLQATELKREKILQFIMKYCLKDRKEMTYAHNQLAENDQQVQNIQLVTKKKFLLHISDRHKHIHDAAYSLQLSTMTLGLTQNLFQAYVHILQAEARDPGLLLQFVLYCKKVEVIAEVNRKIALQNKVGISNFLDVIQCEQLLHELKTEAHVAAKVREAFWSGLHMHVIDMNAIHTSGLEIMSSSHRMQKLWAAIQAIYPYQKEALMLYSQYVYYLLAEKREAAGLQTKLEEAAEASARRWASGRHGLFAETSAIVIISAEQQRLGKVLKASGHLHDMLGYKPSEIEGKDIELLMPRCIAQHHRTFLQDAIRRGRTRNELRSAKRNISSLQQVSLPSFSRDRHGWLSPMFVSHQEVFTYRYGIGFIGLLRHDRPEKDVDYLLTDLAGHIEGVSRDLGQKLKLTTRILSEHKLRLQSLCEEIADQDTLDHLKGYMKLTLKFSQDVARLLRREGSGGGCGEGAGGSGVGPKEGGEIEGQQGVLLECDANKLSYSKGLELMVFKFMHYEEEDEAGALANGGASHKLESKMYVVEPRAATSHESAQHLGILALKRKKVQPERSCSSKSARAHDFMRLQNSSEVVTADHQTIRAGDRAFNLPRPRDNSKLGSGDSKATPSTLSPSLEVQSVGSTTSFSSQARAVRAVRELRNKEMSRFAPPSITRIRRLILAFYLCMAAILVGNTAIVYNSLLQVQAKADLALVNVRRHLAFAYGARAIQQLLFLEDNLTIAAGPNRFYYPALGFATELTVDLKSESDHRAYILRNLLVAVNYGLAAGQELGKPTQNFDPLADSLIDPEAINAEYFGSAMSLGTTLSGYSAAVAFAVHGLRVYQEGKTQAAKFSASFLLNNSLQSYMVQLEDAAGALLNQLTTHIDYQESATFAFFLTVAIIGVLFLIVLVPVISQTTKEMAQTLEYLLGIENHDIHVQLHRLKHFVSIIPRTNAHELNMEVIDYADDSRSEEDSLVEKQGADASPEANQQAKNAKRSRGKQHLPYRGSQVKGILFASVSIGICIMLYFGLDTVVDNMRASYTFYLTELRDLVLIIKDNSFLLAALYRFIGSQGSGLCSTSTCAAYIKATAGTQTTRLNGLTRAHMLSEQLLDTNYTADFYALLCEDACEHRALQQRANCTSIAGGILRKGGITANIDFVDRLLSLYRDFDLSSRDLAAVVLYSNDDRLSELEVLHDHLLRPLYFFLLDALLASCQEAIRTSLLKVLLYVLALAGYLAVLGLWGFRFLVRSLKATVFNTKSMLSSLPTDIIIHNVDILLYLSEANRIVAQNAVAP